MERRTPTTPTAPTAPTTATPAPPLPDVTRRFRGPFARWPRTADAVLGAVLLALTVTLVPGPGDTLLRRSVGDVPLPALAVFTAACAALYWRRRAPLGVAAGVIAAFGVLVPSGYSDIGGAMIIALYSVGRYSDRDVAGEMAVLAASVMIVLDAGRNDLFVGDAIAGVVVMFGAWYFGRYRRQRAEQATQLLREREAEARRIVAEERTRIARELHDVVAHRVSLMTVQAGAAQTIAADDPAAARRAMVAVEEAGRQALDELRHLLGVLRPEVEPGGRDPQPGLTDLPRLVERVRAAGTEVSLAVVDVPNGLPAHTELSAFRIVQEALTNVVKHAGDGAAAQVRVVGDRTSLRIEITDDGVGSPTATAVGAPDAGPGHGLLGMRERTALLGGTLAVGPADGGGFRVVADLPVPTAAGPTDPTHRTDPTDPTDPSVEGASA